MLLLSLFVQQAPQSSMGIIEGTVVQNSSGAPLAEADVTLPEGELGPRRTTQTDANGHFSFTDLKPGVYSIHAEREGFLGPRGASDRFVSATLQVEAGKRAEITLKLIGTATIRGRVLDAEGKPKAEAFVLLLRIVYDGLGHRTWFPLDQDITNEAGEYRIAQVARGEYYLQTFQRRPSQGPSRTGNATTTFFPATTDGAAAAAVVVKEDDEIVADIRERAAETYSVSGQVIRDLPESAAQARIMMRLTPHNAAAPLDPLGVTPLALPAGDDRFEITGVTPGIYDLRAIAIANGTDEYRTEMVVQVRDRNVDNVKMTLHPGVDITGRLIVEGDGQGIAFPRRRPAQEEKPPNILRVNLYRKDGVILPLLTFVGVLSDDPAGTSFKIANVPEGEYVVSASQSSVLPFSTYVADIRSGAQSVFDQGIAVGSSPVALDFIVRSNGGTIQGTITGLGRTPVIAVLVPAPPRRQNPTLYTSLLKTETGALTAESGNFTLHGVPPGNYKLFAWEDRTGTRMFTERPYMNPDYIALYEGRGVPVVVEANATVSGIKIPIIPAGQ